MQVCPGFRHARDSGAAFFGSKIEIFDDFFLSGNKHLDWSYLFVFCSIYYAPVPSIFPNPSILIRGFKHIPLTQVYPLQHPAGLLTLRAENSKLMESFVFVKHLPFGGMQDGTGGFGTLILGGAC